MKLSRLHPSEIVLAPIEQKPVPVERSASASSAPRTEQQPPATPEAKDAD